MELFIIVEPVEDLLFGFVPDGAGVVKDQAGVSLGFNLAVPLLLQCANDLFRVMGIHLAAEGLKVEGFLGCHNNPQYSVIEISEGSELDLFPVPCRVRNRTLSR